MGADGKTANSHPNSYQRYAAYAKATTFSEAVSLGASGPDIFYDFKLGVLSIIDKGNPSAECDSRFQRLSNAWKCRAQGQAPAKFSDPKAILKQTLAKLRKAPILKAGTAANSTEKSSSELQQKEKEAGTEQYQQQIVGRNVVEEAAPEG